MAENINDIIGRTPDGGTAMLPSGEFEGPVYITKPLRVVGNNTTLWAKRGSIIEITAQSVSVENLRVELTEDDVRTPAVVTKHPAEVRNVEVYGAVRGFGREDGIFDIPRTLDLGEFAAESDNTFVMTINVPADAELICSTQGVSVTPQRIPAGRSDVTVSVSGISPQMFLYAELLLKTQFTRRIYITGRPRSDAAKAEMLRVFTAPERSESELCPNGSGTDAHSVVPSSTQNVRTDPFSTAASARTDTVTISAPAPVYDMPLLEMKKGQRVSLYQYVGNSCTLSFSCVKPSDMDIDPYVFLLDNSERSFGDAGLIFFGNETSEHGEARYFPSDGHIDIDFDKIDYRVHKITVAYSIYAGGAARNFSLVQAPKITVTAGGRERITFDMDGLSGETTVVAIEIYRYKGEWKLSAVGAGYRDGMARLCNRYGIEVEE